MESDQAGNLPAHRERRLQDAVLVAEEHHLADPQDAAGVPLLLLPDLSEFLRCLWRLTRHELGSAATFDEAAGTFDLSASTVASLGAVSPGRYRLLTPGRDITGDHLYLLGHPLAQTLVDRASARSLSPAEKVAAQRRIRDLEAERNRKRRALFDAQDQIDRRKDGLISDVEARLRQQVETEPLFTIRWRVE